MPSEYGEREQHNIYGAEIAEQPLTELNYPIYLLAIELKDKIRSGWKVWNIDRQRVESVADLFIENDRPIYTEKVFEEIANYIKSKIIEQFLEQLDM